MAKRLVYTEHELLVVSKIVSVLFARIVINQDGLTQLARFFEQGQTHMGPLNKNLDVIILLEVGVGELFCYPSGAYL